tara:strand:- start:2778 stop:3860 length:1083 start_codon:yes stop_codon:yes gene_type:complete
MKVDFIIVGQGLAGTVLALSLLEKSKSFIIIDNNSTSASSFSAAGISHPLSFKRLILSWNAEKLIPYGRDFYLRSCELINESCFYDQDMIRIFSSYEEQNNWNRKATEVPYVNLLKKSSFPISKHKINAPYGYGSVTNASRLNVSKFVKKAREYFIENKIMIVEDFKHSLLLMQKNECQYKDITCNKIIFCEGPSIKNNPYFNYIPFGFNKGDILTISSNELPIKLLSKGCFVLPTKKNEFIVGSTYNHNDLDVNRTASGRKELIAKLNKLGSFKYEVLSQKSGIRPSSIDRKPIIGEHPLIKNMFLFNGLGSKGVMLAPYFAEELLNAILQNKKTEKEVAVDRFSRLHLQKFKNSHPLD